MKKIFIFYMVLFFLFAISNALADSISEAKSSAYDAAYKTLADYCEADFINNYRSKQEIIKTTPAYEALAKKHREFPAEEQIDQAYEIFAVKSYKILNLTVVGDKAVATVSYDVAARSRWKDHIDLKEGTEWGEQIFDKNINHNYIEKINLVFDSRFEIHNYSAELIGDWSEQDIIDRIEFDKKSYYSKEGVPFVKYKGNAYVYTKDKKLVQLDKNISKKIKFPDLAAIQKEEIPKDIYDAIITAGGYNPNDKRWWILDPPSPKIYLDGVIKFFKHDMEGLMKAITHFYQKNPDSKIEPNASDSYRADKRNLELLESLR